MALAGAILLAIFVLPAPWGAVAIVAGAALEVGEAAFWWWFSRRRRPAVGAETLVGRTATVTSACRPTGQVKLDGEIWGATCAEGADPGDLVRVTAVEALTLVVTPALGAKA